MNRRAWMAVGLASLVGMGIVVLTRIDPRARESRRVQDRLQTLARSVSFSDKDAPLQKLGYPERVVRFFADATALELSLGTFNKQGALTRGDLREFLAGIRAGNRGLEVQFIDIVPELDEPLRSATAHLTAKIYVTGEADYWIQELRVRLEKTSGEWLVTGVTTLRTMEQ